MKYLIPLILLLGLVLISGCTTPKNEADKDSGVRLEEVKIKDETMVLKPGAVYYYGGTYKSPDETVRYHYSVTSSAPVDIYVVASESDFRLIGKGGSFVHYPSCRGIQVLRYDNECVISDEGGIVVSNDNTNSATVTLQVSYFRPVSK